MTESIVINTGPLIALDRIDALDIVAQLPFSFVCPAEVREELDDGHRLGYPLIAPSWLATERLSEPLSRLEMSSLDKGEAAVIHLAAERDIQWVCIDYDLHAMIEDIRKRECNRENLSSLKPVKPSRSSGTTWDGGPSSR